ncbi:class I SAM-dependent methyltransferase [Stappia indica]|nr:class I SAM-dependent methyltransferase [Stappia indica]
MFSLSPASSSNVFRKRRVQRLKAMVADHVAAKGRCRIVDLGGTPEFWHVWRDEMNFDGVTITCINLGFTAGTDGSLPIELVHGSACDLPEHADNSFDVAFSNSVIEHVGSWANKSAFAREARRLAPSHMIQTPSFWFPIEPHARFPLLHWLPDPLVYRIHLAMRTGFYPRAANLDEAMVSLEDARLLDGRQMRYLFPDSELVTERFIGLPKSLMAVRHAVS